MDHDPAVGQCKPFARRSGAEQDRAHRGALPDAVGLDVAGEHLHRIVDRQTGRHRSAGTVDVKVDVLFGIFRLKEEQLCDHQIGDIVIDRSSEQNDPVFEQPAVDIEGTFSLAGLFHHHRNQKRVAFHLAFLLS